MQENMERKNKFTKKAVLAGLCLKKENNVISPLNLYVALGMLAESTAGNTRKQILDAMGCRDIDAVRSSISEIMADNIIHENHAVEILADSLWLNQKYSFHKEAADTLKYKYDADVFSAEMGTSEVDQEIRNWINEKTRKKLQGFTQGIHTDSSEILSLISTVYLKAAWRNSFEINDTDEQMFHGISGSHEVKMMHQMHNSLYYKGNGFLALSLELVDFGTMNFILPDQDMDLNKLMQSDEVLAYANGELDQKKVYRLAEMSIPRFKVMHACDLKEILSMLDITDAMNENADFSPLIDASDPVFLSKGEHAAMIEVDEDGVTGAAYTMMEPVCAGIPDFNHLVRFNVNRPFMFTVANHYSDVLFAGVVYDL